MVDDTGKLSLDALISTCYDGVLDEARWDQALRDFNQWAGGMGFHSVTWDRARHCATRDSHSLEASPDLIREFVEKLAPTDPRVSLMLRQPVGHAMRCHHHLSDRYVARSELYNDFLIPNGVRYTYGLHLDGADGTSELLAILRAPDHSPFEDADTTPELEIITRHIARAARLRAGTRHLQAQAAMGMAVLDQLEMAIVITDETSHAHYLNVAAHQQLGATRNVSIRSGKFTALLPSDDQAVRRLIANATAPMPVAGTHRLHGDKQHWVITALPLRESHACAAPWQRPMVMLTIGELDRRVTLGPYTLKVLFGLSPAEARLAQALAEGRELTQYAQDANVAINTARTQLRHIFDKTGCRRQADLTRLLHAIPALKIHAPG
ncbi:helix-turn-helix transcriptional regulator [Pandoraea fibrosis]|uniref:Helix-turn-helix transcriptional regulator n=1 Tax=Pandoraea fibrosis TaxID=1891094 RepID=A0ABX6HPQ7_9BURK|nr:helix-turn-helix transcriptional regulator [Pandoraea fibrosis]QHE93903.1 helix-turn-helix transcriptional regulator [Pandoraea fibrosis]QHF12534.1 helix-turn-helix transcriptional regulator [Pandoraea fibrosis]